MCWFQTYVLTFYFYGIQCSYWLSTLLVWHLPRLRYIFPSFGTCSVAGQCCALQPFYTTVSATLIQTTTPLLAKETHEGATSVLATALPLHWHIIFLLREGSGILSTNPLCKQLFEHLSLLIVSLETHWRLSSLVVTCLKRQLLTIKYNHGISSLDYWLSSSVSCLLEMTLIYLSEKRLS